MLIIFSVTTPSATLLGAGEIFGGQPCVLPQFCSYSLYFSLSFPLLCFSSIPLGDSHASCHTFVLTPKSPCYNNNTSLCELNNHAVRTLSNTYSPSLCLVFVMCCVIATLSTVWSVFTVPSYHLKTHTKPTPMACFLLFCLLVVRRAYVLVDPFKSNQTNLTYPSTKQHTRPYC